MKVRVTHKILKQIILKNLTNSTISAQYAIIISVMYVMRHKKQLKNSNGC